MVADDGGLAYHNAGAVVDEEIAADLRAGVNIDTGAAVGVLRHHPGDHGNLPQVQLVGNAVYEDGEQPRIGENDLLLVRRCRIAVKRGLNVRHQCLLYAGQLLQYLMGQRRRGKGLALRQRQRHLCRQRRLDTLQQQRGVVLRRQRHQLRVTEICREQQPPKLLDDADDGTPVRQPQLFAVQRHRRVCHIFRHRLGDLRVGSHSPCLLSK